MDALELIVDEGRPANAGRFFQLGSDLLALLDELSEIPIAWCISDLRTGSAVARVTPPSPGTDSTCLRLVVNSLADVQGGRGLPREWSPDAIKVAHRFVEHGQPNEDEGGWTPPRLVLIGDKHDLDVKLTASLGNQLAALQPFERLMPGSVRGELVGLNVSRGNRASLRLPNKKIVRVSFETALRDQLKEALYKQVEISGSVRQDGDGQTFHIRAEEVDVLVKPGSHWVDLFGADRDYLGGTTIDEWLEANRGQA